MYTVYNEGKAVVVERFNRKMKEWMWMYFSVNNTHKYYDILDTLISSYNAKYHRSIKMSPSRCITEKERKKGLQKPVW